MLLDVIIGLATKEKNFLHLTLSIFLIYLFIFSFIHLLRS